MKKPSARWFRRCSSRRGYRCTAVSNGRAAQDQVKRVTPDLVLSDMIMPEMDGIKLLDWIRHYDPKCQ